MNRRLFLKSTALASVLATVGQTVMSGVAYAKDAAAKLLLDAEGVKKADAGAKGMITALKYVPDHTKATGATPKTNSKTKVSVEAKCQSCESCSLYKAEAGKDYGACTIFPKNNVPAKAYCGSYQVHDKVESVDPKTCKVKMKA